MDLSAILKNTDLIYPFLQHLKKNGGVNYLHFCLAVETFNKKMMVVDLSEEDFKNLHSSAKDLYDTYIKIGAPNFIKFDDDVVRDISEIINQGHNGKSDSICNKYESIFSSQRFTSCAPPLLCSELMSRSTPIWRITYVRGSTLARRFVLVKHMNLILNLISIVSFSICSLLWGPGLLTVDPILDLRKMNTRSK